MKFKRSLALLAAIALLGAACGGGGGDDDNGDDDVVAEETVDPTPTVGGTEFTCPDPPATDPSTGALYDQDFTDPAPFAPIEGTLIHAESECLVLQTEETGDTVYETPSLEELAVEGTIAGSTLTGMPRVALEADVATLAGGVDNLHGLVCGADETYLYFLGMSNEGRGVIALANGGSLEVIADEPGAAPAVPLGTSTRLRAECDVGSFEAHLAVYADGQLLVETNTSNLDLYDASDGQWQNLGIVIGSGGEGAAVAFDNFALYDLPQQ